MSENKNDQTDTQTDLDFSIDFVQVEEVSRVFFEESNQILKELDHLILRWEAEPSDQDLINQIFRKVHTIKGSVGAVPGGQLLGSLSHEFEALLNRIKKENLPVTKECIDLSLKSTRMLKVLAQSLSEKRELYPEELSEAIELIANFGTFTFPHGAGHEIVKSKESLTVPGVREAQAGVWLSVDQLNEFLRISGELLVLKNYYQTINQTVDVREQPELFQRRQADFSQNLSKLCDQFQKQVQVVRKETARESFQGLHVIVRQAAMELNKTVHFEIHGDEMLIDKDLGKDLYEALVHVARNSVDHGIEDQFERTLAGKNPTGHIALHISEKNNVISLLFKDDGHGLDREKILQQALKKGIVSQVEIATLKNDQIYRYIFNAGFSTKDKVTTISGRGVGMDIVQSTVEQYGGKILIESEVGAGTTFRFDIPVPQHILVETALLCTWREMQFAIPLASIAHVSTGDEILLTEVDGLRYCQFHGQTVPLLNFQEIVNSKISETAQVVKKSSAVFIKVQDLTFALLVDQIEAQTDLVVKSFGDIVGEQQGFKGVSILADEKITYVIAPEGLAQFLLHVPAEGIAA